METLEEKIQRVLKDEIVIRPPSEHWPEAFDAEKTHLLACLPNELIVRIEHFGSTAVPGLPAKPIVDMLVEVTDLEAAKDRIAPVLEAQGYDYFWRPFRDEDPASFYAWFIKRDENGNRTHHIHMAEGDFAIWEGLVFRDYLRAHPKTAAEYGALKLQLATLHRNDREAYTNAKTNFIRHYTDLAQQQRP